MKKFYPFLVLILSCKASQQLVCPACPPPPPAVTKTIYIHDTTYQAAPSAPKSADTGAAHIIHLVPVAGDNSPSLQQALDYCIATPGWHIKLGPGVYHTFSTLLALKLAGPGTYAQVSFVMEGAADAQDAPDAQCSIIEPNFRDKPALAIQLGKGVTIKWISFAGLYTLPDHISPFAMQTLRYRDWDDGISRADRYTPYCGAAVDPFSDTAFLGYADRYPGLEKYYLTGMSRSGSTGVDFIGCKFIHFVAGIIFQPQAQQNGDLCNVIHCTVEYCKVGLAYCQDQTKGDYVRNLRCWGHTHTVITTNLIGRGNGCMPFVDGMNIAGGVYQIFQCVSGGRFTGGATGVYGEMIFKIGYIGGRPSPGIYNSTFDFMDFGWRPDYYVMGGADFRDCNIRIYNGQVNRLWMGSFPGKFSGGAMQSVITAGIWQGGVYSDTPTFDHVRAFDIDAYAGKAYFYQGRPHDGALILDSRNPGSVLSVDSVNYQMTIQLTGPGQVAVGDYVLAGEEGYLYYDTDLLSINQATVVVGRVMSVSGSIAVLDQVNITMLGMRGKPVYFFKSIP